MIEYDDWELSSVQNLRCLISLGFILSIVWGILLMNGEILLANHYKWNDRGILSTAQ